MIDLLFVFFIIGFCVYLCIEEINKIKDLKYIHYFKWSFSLVVSSLAMMLCNDKVTRCVFKITEEKQRNAYIENGKIITKVPESYKK